jgi:hypothetical protein
MVRNQCAQILHFKLLVDTAKAEATMAHAASCSQATYLLAEVALELRWSEPTAVEVVMVLDLDPSSAAATNATRRDLTRSWLR